MSRLTAEERQKVARFRSGTEDLTWVGGAHAGDPAGAANPPLRLFRRAVEAAAAAAVLAGALLASRLLQFEAPRSVVEILLPRL